jgi:hypothetical protein
MKQRARSANDSVTGLNLDDPLSAGRVIKTWDERLDEEIYVESGVDDDVSPCIPNNNDRVECNVNVKQEMEIAYLHF